MNDILLLNSKKKLTIHHQIVTHNTVKLIRNS